MRTTNKKKKFPIRQHQAFSKIVKETVNESIKKNPNIVYINNEDYNIIKKRVENVIKNPSYNRNRSKMLKRRNNTDVKSCQVVFAPSETVNTNLSYEQFSALCPSAPDPIIVKGSFFKSNKQKR
ncbi:MAG: hypothetical protein IJ489_00870 [Clostridia bacterium]|nr:hypothetical protein [Clostridia bacterium]